MKKPKMKIIKLKTGSQEQVKENISATHQLYIIQDDNKERLINQ